MKSLIGQIKKSVVLFAIVCLLMPFVAEDSIAQNWQTVYQTDFSGDPGWTTSNPSNYHWDGPTQTFFTNNYTNSGAIAGDWATTDITYNGESFQLTFDVLPTRSPWETGDVCIGLFGPSRESHSGTEERIFILIGGYYDEIYMEGQNSGAEAIQSPESIAYGSMVDNEWHHCAIAYDAITMVVTATVTRNAATVFNWSMPMTSGFSSSLSYLGVSMKGSWSQAGRHEIAYIDNVTFELETCHKYAMLRIPDESFQWIQCRDSAIALGGHLGTVTSQEEFDFVYSLFPSLATFEACWLGGTDENLEGTWEWITGETWSFTAWASGEPNNNGNEDYVYMRLNPKNWNDSKIIWPNSYFLVEWECINSVSLDIKPGHCPNYIKIDGSDDEDIDVWAQSNNLTAAKDQPNHKKKKHKKLKVAILGTADFDASLIDPSTVLLAGVAPLKSELEDEATPVADPANCACTEDEEDGIVDLELKFSLKDIMATLGEVSDGDIIELAVTGNLYDGTPFEGTDCIWIRADDDDDKNGSTIALSNTPVLKSNYPNPFNPATEISFSLPNAGPATLEVFNLSGRKVTTLIDRTLEAGTHTVTWDAAQSASGIYFYRLTSGDFVETRKMILLK